MSQRVGPRSPAVRLAHRRFARSLTHSRTREGLALSLTKAHSRAHSVTKALSLTHEGSLAKAHSRRLTHALTHSRTHALTHSRTHSVVVLARCSNTHPPVVGMPERRSARPVSRCFTQHSAGGDARTLTPHSDTAARALLSQSMCATRRALRPHRSPFEPEGLSMWLLDKERFRLCSLVFFLNS